MQISIPTHDCLQQVCNVKLERNSKNIYTQKNAEHVNEFCRCCNASLKVTYGDTWKSVSIVNLLKPTVGQDSFEVLLQISICIFLSITKATKRMTIEYFKASTEHLSRTFSADPLKHYYYYYYYYNSFI